MNRENSLINALLEDADKAVLYDKHADELLVSHGDMWEYVRGYFAQYRVLPSKETLREKFHDFEIVATKEPSAYYLDEVKRVFTNERIRELTQKAEKAIKAKEDPGVIARKLTHALSGLAKYTDKSVDVNIMDFDEAARHYQLTREIAAARGGTPGIPTGISSIDSAYTTGFLPGHFILIIGFTGRMKSFVSTLFACNAYIQGYKPMIVSLEMPPEQVRDRVYTILGNGTFSNSGLSIGDVNIDDFRTWTKHQPNHDFVVVGATDGEVTPNLIAAKVDEHKPDIIILDYFQLMSDNKDSGDMTGRMRNLSKETKKLAMSAGVPIIGISSATPESGTATKEPPMIEQVAWSKQLAYDADFAMAVHGDAMTGIVPIVGRKNRGGPLFDCVLQWDVDAGKLTEVLFD